MYLLFYCIVKVYMIKNLGLISVNLEKFSQMLLKVILEINIQAHTILSAY